MDRNMLKSVARRLGGGMADGQPPAGGAAGFTNGAPEAMASEGTIKIPAMQVPDGIKLGSKVNIAATVDNVTPDGAEITILEVMPIESEEKNELRDEINAEKEAENY